MRIGRAQDLGQRRHTAALAHNATPRPFLIVLPVISPTELVALVHVDGILRRGIPARRQAEFAVDADVQRAFRRLPEKSRWRNGERIAHVPGIAARRRGKRALHVVADERLHQPLVAVETDGAAGVEIIQQHIALRQSVLVGRDLAPVDAQLGIAVALGDVPKDLIVGAVFLDDEKDVPDAERR